MAGEEAARCSRCGRELNMYMGRKGAPEWYGAAKYTHYCIDCQQDYYDALEKVSSPSLAYFYCCIAFNVPFDFNCLNKSDASEKPWIDYLDELRRTKRGEDRGTPLGFLDGLTAITKIFGADLGRGEFSKAVDMEKSAREKRQGSKAQRDHWGTGPEKRPYQTKDYDELDRIYSAFSRNLEAQGTLDPKQEYILRDCAKMELEKNQYIHAGNVNMAQKLNGMIQTNLASENLRKKDEKPVEDLRIDSIVDALEKKGYMKAGKLLSYDQLLEKLRGDVPRYRYTKDAADQMLLYIINTMRSNEGLSEYTSLPDEYRITDGHADEFAREPSEQEREAYEKLGLLRMPPVRKMAEEAEDADAQNG